MINAAEEAAVNRGIAADPDNPEWTDKDWRAALPASETLPAMVTEHVRRLRGPQKTQVKRAVSIRLDQDLLERLRATGPGWQSRINHILRRAMS